jgi:hypothetical protein
MDDYLPFQKVYVFFQKVYVATLALGLQPRQGVARL